jgi:hypothetical protein
VCSESASFTSLIESPCTPYFFTEHGDTEILHTEYIQVSYDLLGAIFLARAAVEINPLDAKVNVIVQMDTYANAGGKINFNIKPGFASAMLLQEQSATFNFIHPSERVRYQLIMPPSKHKVNFCYTDLSARHVGGSLTGLRQLLHIRAFGNQTTSPHENQISFAVCSCASDAGIQ